MVPITLFLDSRKFILDVYDLQENILGLCKNIKSTLQNQLRLGSSFTADPGYMFNYYIFCVDQEECSIILPFVYERDNNDHWIGYEYQLWGCENLTAWLYNNAAGDIIFEVTPLYPEDEKESFNQDDFMLWRNNYEPVCFKTLSKQKVEKWLNIAEALIQKIENSFKD